MYIPADSREDDPELLLDVVDAYPFATLITSTASEPLVTHVPLILRQRTTLPYVITGHVARANPHGKALEQGLPTLAIFHGPHAYVSPAWYANHPSVPTWVYVAVHAHGRPRTVGDDGAQAVLARMIERFESGRTNRWDGVLPESYSQKMRAAITAFELPIERLEGKFKLNQRKHAADQAGALAGLEQDGGPAEHEVAVFTRKYLAQRAKG